MRQTPVNETASLGLSPHLLRSSETRTFSHLRTGLFAVHQCICSQTRALRLGSTESVHQYVPFTHKHTHKGHTTFPKTASLIVNIRAAAVRSTTCVLYNCAPKITGGHLITVAVWHSRHSCDSGAESWSPQPALEGLSQSLLLSPLPNSTLA